MSRDVDDYSDFWADELDDDEADVEYMSIVRENKELRDEVAKLKEALLERDKRIQGLAQKLEDIFCLAEDFKP